MKIFPIEPIYKILNPFKNLGSKLFYSKKKKKEDSDEFTELLKGKKKLNK